MTERLLWKITYADDSTYSSDDGSWEEAPLDEVMGVLSYDEDGRVRGQVDQADYYLMMPLDDTVIRISQMHIERHLRRLLPQLKYGIWVPEAKWRAYRDKYGA